MGRDGGKRGGEGQGWAGAGWEGEGGGASPIYFTVTSVDELLISLAAAVMTGVGWGGAGWGMEGVGQGGVETGDGGGYMVGPGEEGQGGRVGRSCPFRTPSSVEHRLCVSLSPCAAHRTC